MTGKIEITHYEPRGDYLHDFTVLVRVGEFADEHGTLMVLDVNDEGQAEFGVTLDTDKRRNSEIVDAGANPIQVSSAFEDALLDECERFLRYFDKTAVMREVVAQTEAALGAMASDDSLTEAGAWDPDKTLQALRDTIMHAAAEDLDPVDAIDKIESLFDELDSNMVVGNTPPSYWAVGDPLRKPVEEAEPSGDRVVVLKRSVNIRQHQTWRVVVPVGMKIVTEIEDDASFDDYVVAHGELLDHDDEDLPADLGHVEYEIESITP